MSILHQRVGWNRRVCIVALVIVLASVCVFGLIRGPMMNMRPSAKAATRGFQQELKPVNLLATEHITVRATGFEPSEVIRQAGSFLLAVDNRAGVGELRFNLVPENGILPTTVLVENKKLRLRRVVDLLPGRYSLRVVDHPKWVCTIVVTAP